MTLPDLNGPHPRPSTGSHAAPPIEPPAAAEPTLLAAPERSFIRRNALGLLLLIPALALAVATTSMNWFTLYRPFQMTSAHEASSDGWASMDIHLEPDGIPVHREVSARLSRVGEGAVSAAQGWHATAAVVEFSAPHGSPLSGCAVRIVGSDGAEYAPDLVAADAPASSPSASDGGGGTGIGPGGCVPEESPGPTYGIGDTQVHADASAPSPRPEQWRRRIEVALPAGVQIREVRIGWEPPDYLALTPAR